MKQGINRIPSFSVIVVFIALALLGCGLSIRLPVKLSPSESLPSLTVSFSMVGPPRIVESEVTGRLESMLTRVAGVQNIYSRSSNGHGYVTLSFDRSADMEFARFETAMIVRQLWSDMPADATYPEITMEQIDEEGARPFMSFSLNADETPSQIMRYAEDHIRPALAAIPGVSKVEISGATPKEWQIEYDSDQLQNLQIDLQQMREALSKRGVREFLSPQLSLVMAEESDSLTLSDIIVAEKNGRIITLDNIATLSHSDRTPSGYYRINGLNSLYLNITSTQDANQIVLSGKIKETLDAIKESLPEGYMLSLNYDASQRIREELNNIYMRSVLTVIILLLFVGLITLNFRYLMMVAISLALNIAIAFVFYYLSGVEIQLYSLAGITISLNLIIDNIIVMTEHITRRGNLRAFTALLAATLTTIGALSIVFFLDEKTILGLKDFVMVVLINLIVSLFVSLFLVPALIERMGVRARNWRLKKKTQISTSINDEAASPILAEVVGSRFRRIELALLNFLCRFKGWVYLVFILGFGLPVFLLPEKTENEGLFASAYNAVFGSSFYKDQIRPLTDKILGGSLRLFVEKVYNGEYYGRTTDEPVLYINSTLPNGATLEQMNELTKKMERFLATQVGIRQFHTRVYGPRRASISVYFKPDQMRNGYPYRLKSNIISKALTLGGGSWSVYGLEDMGFSNDIRESAGNSRIKLTGYNYDDLMHFAEAFRDSLLSHRRIRDVSLVSEFTWWKDDFSEFYLDVDKGMLALQGLSIGKLYEALTENIGSNIYVGTIVGNDGYEDIRLSSKNRNSDVWAFMKIPFKIGNKFYKLEDFADIRKSESPSDIVKDNQEYILCLQYDYIGSNKLSEKVLKESVDKFNRILPVGYRAQAETYNDFDDNHARQYWLILLVVVIIFFISAILFNSLRQPLAIIFVIPVSFIGIFLTFYLFNLRFDQGGFASFVLLSGITVNAAIYIINEYNSIRNRNPGQSALECYMEAFNFKIVAVLLTVISTILGFIPFLIGDIQLAFWFPLASGTMGGLLFSLLAIFFLLPPLILPRHKNI